jgi:peptidoglycan/LPS O-acetylase OafA/YrhL
MLIDSKASGNKTYFPGLNSLRFFAALLVIIHHIEFVKAKLGLPNRMDIVFFQRGHYGVVLFFVLSGFLITYLLLEENRDTGQISIKKFYLKRILRIWPLYYLMVSCIFLFLFLTKAGLPLALNLSLYMFILPNLAFVLFPPVEGIYHLWTIGVEEQFYLLWPLKLKYLKKHLLIFFIFLIFFFPLLRILLLYFYKRFSSEVFYIKITQFVLTLEFECMAVGGLFAYLIFHNYNLILKYVYARTVQIIAYFVILYSLFYDLKDFYLNSIFISLLFGILIINVGTNRNSLIKLEYLPLNFLGRISYGLYIYHLVIIYIAIKYLPIDGLNGWNYIENLLLYIVVILSTIAISAISYYLLEKRFLTVKGNMTATGG